MAQSSSAFTPAPPRWILSTAAFASQLLGTFAFAFALAWIYKGDRLPLTMAILVLGAASVFAGGHAGRGSASALGVCAAFDTAVAIACLCGISISSAKAYVHAPLTWAAPSVANELPTAMAIAGVVAALAACACIAAVPQMRRFAAWRGEQILHAARVWHG